MKTNPETNFLRRTLRSALLMLAAAGCTLPALEAVAQTTVTLTPATTGPLVRSGRFFTRDNKPVLIVGAGGPEGFLYEDDARKQAIIDELKTAKVNGIYFHSIRAFGGDGKNNGNEHPFVSGTDKTLSASKLQHWAGFLDQLDQAGIVMWFTLFDDHSNPWGCYSAATKADYLNYATQMVNTFKAYKNLVWVTQEEWNWTDRGCTAAQNRSRQQDMAAAIRAADPVHAIAVHHMNGTSYQFSGQSAIDIYGQQTGDSDNAAASANTVTEIHDRASKEGWASGVMYAMAEAHPYHKDLIKAGNRTELRQSIWANALGGAAGIWVYDMYECHDPRSYGVGAWLCSGPNAGANPATPTSAMLADMQRLKAFMNGTRFNETAPLFGTAATARIAGSTQWLMLNDAKGLYLLYSNLNPSSLGVKSATAGTYDYKWFDPVSGLTSTGSVVHASGNLVLNRPAGFGSETVVWAAKR